MTTGFIMGYAAAGGFNGMTALDMLVSTGLFIGLMAAIMGLVWLADRWMSR